MSAVAGAFRPLLRGSSLRTAGPGNAAVMGQGTVVKRTKRRRAKTGRAVVGLSQERTAAAWGAGRSR